jgi:hypothetical protein
MLDRPKIIADTLKETGSAVRTLAVVKELFALAAAPAAEEAKWVAEVKRQAALREAKYAAEEAADRVAFGARLKAARAEERAAAEPVIEIHIAPPPRRARAKPSRAHKPWDDPDEIATVERMLAKNKPLLDIARAVHRTVDAIRAAMGRGYVRVPVWRTPSPGKQRQGFTLAIQQGRAIRDYDRAEAVGTAAPQPVNGAGPLFDPADRHPAVH